MILSFPPLINCCNGKYILPVCYKSDCVQPLARQVPFEQHWQVHLPFGSDSLLSVSEFKAFMPEGEKKIKFAMMCCKKICAQNDAAPVHCKGALFCQEHRKGTEVTLPNCTEDQPCPPSPFFGKQYVRCTEKYTRVTVSTDNCKAGRGIFFSIHGVKKRSNVERQMRTRYQ